jgi:regulator of sigma E protease
LIGGPVAIVQMSAQIGREGLRRLLWFCGFLQVNLAILNLLPIPILDGGHLVVSLVEGISRRTFSVKQREVLQYIGLAFLLPLFLFVFINDFARIGLFSWIAGLFT